MKDIIKKIDKNKLLVNIGLRTLTYIIWYIMALLFIIFVKDGASKISLLLLVALCIVCFIARFYLKKLYNDKKNANYFNIKHTTELYLFKKIDGLKNSDVYELDKEKLTNKILHFTYNVTKLYSDIENCMIPLLIGAIVLFVMIAKVSVLFAILITLLVVALCIYKYKDILLEEENNWSSYNDMLRDFLYKLNTIKKLNLFDFCYKKLENDIDNKEVVVGKDYKEDMFFNNCLYGLGFLVLVGMILSFDSYINAIGYMIFCGLMMLKIKTLLYRLCPCIKNILDLYSNYDELNAYFVNNVSVNTISNFKKIEIDNMVYSSKDSPFSITVNELEIEKGDEISIIGKPGEGKSTILNVLSGMYKLDTGVVIVDDKPLTGRIDLAHISFNDDVFKLSLRDNLTLGKKVDDEVILQYIDEAGLSEWFGLLLGGLETVLDENVIEITPADRIKFNIIRGIILDKPLYLIDDFGDILDIDEEKALSEMIKKYLRKKTFIIVAHKPIFTTICKKHYFIKNHTLLEKETLL